MKKNKKKLEALENDVREVREELFKHVVILNNKIVKIESRLDARNSFFQEMTKEEGYEVKDAAVEMRDFFIEGLHEVPFYALRDLLALGREVRIEYLSFMSKLVRFNRELERYINEDYTPFIRKI